MVGFSEASSSADAALVSQVAGVAPLREDERRWLREMSMAPAVRFARGRDLLGPAMPIERAYFLTSGWALCHEILPDGSRRVFDFLLAGDLAGLGTLVLERELRLRGVRTPPESAAPLWVTALTEVSAVPVEMAVVDTLMRGETGLGGLLLALAISDDSTRLRRRLALAGRPGARARTAGLLLELWQRQRAVGIADDSGFEMPASQSLLGEFLGVAPAYLCRILAEFGREGIVTVGGNGRRAVAVHDGARLAAIAGDGRAAA